MKLQDIHSPADIKGLELPELETLASDIRSALLEKLSRHGGHIGPNLGMVEMSIALHYVFDLPTDKIMGQCFYILGLHTLGLRQPGQLMQVFLCHLCKGLLLPHNSHNLLTYLP